MPTVPASLAHATASAPPPAAAASSSSSSPSHRWSEWQAPGNTDREEGPLARDVPRVGFEWEHGGTVGLNVGEKDWGHRILSDRKEYLKKQSLLGFSITDTGVDRTPDERDPDFAVHAEITRNHAGNPNAELVSAPFERSAKDLARLARGANAVLMPAAASLRTQTTHYAPGKPVDSTWELSAGARSSQTRSGYSSGTLQATVGVAADQLLHDEPAVRTRVLGYLAPAASSGSKLLAGHISDAVTAEKYLNKHGPAFLAGQRSGTTTGGDGAGVAASAEGAAAASSLPAAGLPAAPDAAAGPASRSDQKYRRRMAILMSSVAENVEAENTGGQLKDTYDANIKSSSGSAGLGLDQRSADQLQLLKDPDFRKGLVAKLMERHSFSSRAEYEARAGRYHRSLQNAGLPQRSIQAVHEEGTPIPSFEHQGRLHGVIEARRSDAPVVESMKRLLTNQMDPKDLEVEMAKRLGSR